MATTATPNVTSTTTTITTPSTAAVTAFLGLNLTTGGLIDSNDGVPFSFNPYEAWQVDSNPYYAQYLNYSLQFTNLTNPIEEPPPEVAAWEVPVKACACIVLIFLSATFSGLTLGLMGLDPYGLELIIQANPEGEDAQMAAKILRYVRNVPSCCGNNNTPGFLFLCACKCDCHTQ